MNLTLDIQCDSAPLALFTKLLQGAFKVSERALNFSDLPFELVRVESDLDSAATGKLLVTLYPSDAFLGFAAASLAGYFDLCAIKKSGHNDSPPGI